MTDEHVGEIEQDLDKEISKDYDMSQATYMGMKETMDASGPDYGHGQLFQLGKIILDDTTPKDEKTNAYRLLMLVSLALLNHANNQEKDEYQEQLQLWENGVKNGTKDNTKN